MGARWGNWKVGGGSFYRDFEGKDSEKHIMEGSENEVFILEGSTGGTQGT